MTRHWGQNQLLQGATLPIPEPTADAARKGMHGILLKRHAALRLAGHGVFNVLRGTAPSSTGLHVGRSVATRPRRGARAAVASARRSRSGTTRWPWERPPTCTCGTRAAFPQTDVGPGSTLRCWRGRRGHTHRTRGCRVWGTAPIVPILIARRREITGLKLWRSVSLGALSRLSLTPGWLSWRHGRRRGVLRRHGRRLGRRSTGVRRPGRRVPTKLRGRSHGLRTGSLVMALAPATRPAGCLVFAGLGWGGAQHRWRSARDVWLVRGLCLYPGATALG